MKNSVLLFGKNLTAPCLSTKFVEGRLHIKFSSNAIDGVALKRFISTFTYFDEKYHTNFPIYINFKRAFFTDKLTLVLFETICYHVIRELNHAIQLHWDEDTNLIFANGYKSSPLMLLTTGKKKHLEEYKNKYFNDSYMNHFRVFVSGDTPSDSSFVNDLLFQFNTFFKLFQISSDVSKKMAEFLGKLVGNANEHTNTDCILDIDVTEPKYVKKNDDPNKLFYGLNVAVVNFSNILLGDGIKKLLANNNILEGRYGIVKNAFNNHKRFFNDNYTESDFYMITTFQHHISGRSKIESTGGTGLTKLISSLEKMADSHHCYVVSGNRKLILDKDFLEYTKDDWIGFNKNNNYLEEAPEASLLINNDIYLPGTAYNLNLVLLKGEQNE